jgi:epsilon-lactone hydrolase
MPSQAYLDALHRVQAYNATLQADASTAARRTHYDGRGSLFALPEGIQRSAVMAAGRPGEFLLPDGGDPLRVILFLHPGGFSVGSMHSHRPLAAGLAAASGGRVLSVSYRLAPEHPFPAPVEDAVKAYRWLLDLGIEAKNVALCGASAGGAVAAAAAMQIRAQARTMRDIALPGALVLLCPWLDLALTSNTPTTADPLNNVAGLREAAKAYLGPNPATHAIASPLHGDWSGLPPVHVQGAGADVLQDDARRAIGRISAAGGRADLLDGRDLCHVWQGFGVGVPEAKEALDQAGAFVNGVWDNT